MITSPLFVALVMSIATLVFSEMRNPPLVTSTGWLWAFRTINLVSFFIISLLVVGLVKSFV